MDEKTKYLVIIIAIALILAVALTFQKTVLEKDFTVTNVASEEQSD